MIYVGTSGYSFADWCGPFYPEGTRKEQMLPFYARHFPVAELNFTFYAMPAEKTLARMADITPPNFQFIVKANQELTHNRNRQVADPFLAALEPCRAAGKLSGILAQFPYAFQNDEASRRYLAELRDSLARDPLIVEFRHKSWGTPAVLDFLRRLKIGYCCVDEPKLPGLLPPTAEATSNVAYVRFHSRDASKWFGTEGQERYNYCYSKGEMQEWTPKVEKFAGNPDIEKIFVFFNNCHAGHAAVNAIQFQEMLKELGLL